MSHIRPFMCMCESSEGSGASEQLLIEYAICTPILCMCESSEGNDKTACMLLLVCALAERICHIFAHLCACSRAVKALARLHVYSGASEHSLKDGICHMYAHFVHVREQ